MALVLATLSTMYMEEPLLAGKMHCVFRLRLFDGSPLPPLVCKLGEFNVIIFCPSPN